MSDGPGDTEGRDDAAHPTGNREQEPTADAGGAALEAAWQTVMNQWQDPSSHERFLALCEAMGAASEAGARYRAVRDEDPERASDAQARLDQLVARALARLQLERSEVSPTPRRWLFVLALLAAGCLLTAALRMLLG